jgi:hypothetical protein
MRCAHCKKDIRLEDVTGEWIHKETGKYGCAKGKEVAEPGRDTE